MLTITPTALVVFTLTAALCLDLVFSGILFILRGMRPAGTAMLALGTLLSCIPFTVLARYTHIPVAVYGLLLWTSLVIYLLYRRANRQAAKASAADAEGEKRITEERPDNGNGKYWVRTVVKLMRATGKNLVRFDDQSCDGDTPPVEAPWCKALGAKVDYVCLIPMPGEDCIPRAVEVFCTVDGKTVRKDLYGIGDEDYGALFNRIYERVTGMQCEDAEEYLLRQGNMERVDYFTNDILLSAVYNPLDTGVTATAFAGAVRDPETDEPVREIRCTLFPDQGYWKATVRTASGARKTAGMFSGNDTIHPDIADIPGNRQEEPRWLSYILGLCDDAGFTPYTIRIVSEQ